MLSVPVGHFTEATAVWCGCVLAFVLIIALRRVWIQRAMAMKRTVKATTDAEWDLDRQPPTAGPR